MRRANPIRVPEPTLGRLATYLRYLIDLEHDCVTRISSAEFENLTGINAAQFRKDLSYFGDFGKPGVGYDVSDLRDRIAKILQVDTEQKVLLVGAGNLGAALVGYPGLQEEKFRLAGVFDNNYAKIGRNLWDMEILDISKLEETNARLKARIAIIAVPRGSAQDVADTLVRSGVRAILNFAPAAVRVPDHVTVRNVLFVQELAVLAYHLSAAPEDTPDAD